MNEEMIDLSRRVILCKNWRWMPGMKDMEGWRLYREVVGFTAQDKDGKTVTGWDAIGGEWEYHQVAHFPKLPDLSDPATLGCLLILVREAWKDLTASTAATKESDGKMGWVMDCWEPQSPLNGIGPFSTEIEALVVALEAAQ